MYGSDLDLAERRKLNWRAVAAGTTAALGIQVLMLYFGGALGIARFQVHAGPAREWGVLVPAVYLLFTTLLAAFCGAWITGHWANLYASEDAFLHGGMTWALYALIITAGLGNMLESGARFFKSPNKEPAPPQESDTGYSPLKDQAFLDFAANRAREFANNERDPLQAKTVSAAEQQFLYSAEFQRLIQAEVDLSDDETRAFLSAESAALAQEQQRTERAWQRLHHHEHAMQESERKSTAIVGWSLLVIALMSLGASVTGAYLGWRQRYVNFADPDLMLEDELRAQYPKAM